MPSSDAPSPRSALASRGQSMLAWLPEASDFGAELRHAREAADPTERLEALAALARHRLDFLETIQLDRALGSVGEEPTPGFSRVRLALLSAATVDHLVPAIRVAALRRRLRLDVYVGGYGQYRQELYDERSGLRGFHPDVVLFSLTAREMLAAAPLSASAAEIESFLDASINELRALWQKARDDLGAAVVQQTLLNFADPLFGSYDRLVPGAPARLIARLNDRLGEAGAADAALLLDVARASERQGLDAWFDTTRWLQAKFEIAPQASLYYGELVARLLAAQRGLSRKCLVLDLDNTLWGGVVGDDGIEGIVLGEGSPRGEAHLALQRYAKQLRERGVILAVCSKNEPEIAEAAFRDHPEMLLKRSDIAAFVANWNDKAANLELISRQLNIGIDSLVFVDDNPAERARIRQSLPAVAVPELPDDVGRYVRTLADAGYFEAIAFTADDRQRGDQYAANAERAASLEAAESMDDFLDGLEMEVAAGPFRAVDLPRIAQLINKTNQFNTTTRRHSLEDVTAFARDERCLTLQFRLSDRFGDNGLISAMVLRPIDGAADALEIDTWVMSCRVFGRQLEIEAMNIAVEAARGRGIGSFRADYLPTAKNGVIRELYPGLGFVRADVDPPGEGSSRWTLLLDEYTAPKTHIARRSEPHD